MSNWPLFRAVTNITQKQIAKSQSTIQGRIVSVNKQNGTANVIVRRQTASGLAYPTADTALTQYCPAGSLEIPIPDASAFKLSTFAIISSSNPGKIEKIHISNIRDYTNNSGAGDKLVLSSPTLYDHPASTRVIGVNTSVLGETTLTQNAAKGSEFISLSDYSFVVNQLSQSSSIRKKVFLKISRKNDIVIDNVTVLDVINGQVKITPALSYDFRSGDNVLATNVPNVDFDSQDEVLLENISIKPNGTDYSYATINQPVLLAAIEGNKSDLVIVGPASAMNVSDFNHVNFDSKIFSVVIESVEEYTSDLVKQYDDNNNLLPDVLIRKYDLSNSKDARELDEIELARKIKVNIGLRVPYDFFLKNSENQNWIYAIACGTEIDPPLDSNNNPVRELDVGGTGFSGFNVQGLPLNNFFYGLDDWKKFSTVKDASELLNLEPSRYAQNFELTIEKLPRTFNQLIDPPPSGDSNAGAGTNANADVGKNAKSNSRKKQYVYLKTFVIFNYKPPSHFYDDQGSTDDTAKKKLKSRNGKDINFAIKICAGRMSYLSQKIPDPIMPNIVSYQISFKNKGPYRIDSNAAYPPRMYETPSSGPGNTPRPGTSIPGTYRGEVGWDLETATQYESSSNINTHILNNETLFFGNESFFKYNDGYTDFKLYIALQPANQTTDSSGTVYTADIKNGYYVGVITPSTSLSRFNSVKKIPAGTKFLRIQNLIQTGEEFVLDEDIDITPQLAQSDIPTSGLGDRQNFKSVPVYFSKSSLKFRQVIRGLNSFVTSSSAFESLIQSFTGFFNWLGGKYKNRERAIKKYKFGGYGYIGDFENDVIISLTELKESRFKNFSPDRVMYQTSIMDRIPSTKMPDFFRVNISLGVRKSIYGFRYDHFNRCTQFYRNNDESPWYYNLLGEEDDYDDGESNQAVEVSPGNFLIGVGSGSKGHSRNAMKFFHDKNMMFYSDDIDVNNIDEKSITYTAGEDKDTVGYHSGDYIDFPSPYWQIVYPATRGQLIDVFGKYEGMNSYNRGINVTKCRVGVECIVNTTGKWEKGDTKAIFRFNLSPDDIYHNYANYDRDPAGYQRLFTEGMIRIIIQPVYSVNGKFKIGNSSVFFAEDSKMKSYSDMDAGCYKGGIVRIT